MRLQNFLKAGVAVATLVAASATSATVIYSVSSTPNINCSSDPHGLWTNQYNNAGCNEYYDFSSGSTLTVDKSVAGSEEAVLVATARNGVGTIATIDIIFGGYMDTYSPVKEGGGSYNPGPPESPDWDFFTFIESGSISFDNGDVFDVLLVGQPSVNNASGNKPVLQIGLGANDKTGDLGASAWLDAYNASGPLGNHWDLNMNLVVDGVSPPSDVPVPGSLALIGLGLLGLGWSRRKKA